MKTENKLLLFLILLFTTFTSYSESVKLSVSTGRGRGDIAVGEEFHIAIQVNDIEQAPQAPSTVPGAKVLYFAKTGQSSQFSSVNGQVSQTYSYTYTLTLRATSEGSFSFGPISVGNVKSNTVHYNIVKERQGASSLQGGNPYGMDPSASSRPEDNKPKYIGKGDGNLFLKAEVSKSNAYPQEALVYTVKLYTTFDAIKFIGATAAPKFEGFVVEESNDISTSLVYENYNGKTYASAVIARYIIFPQMEGELKVKGNTYTVSVDEREYYHDPFWGQMSVARPLQLNVTPNDLTVSVKPLPTPIPANFSGGVGQFNITSNLPSQNFASNTAASIVYTVSGTGNLKYISLPDLNNIYPPQLEVYTPTVNVETNVGKTSVSGKVIFDYSFMPLESGTYKIPQVSLVYFNPATGKYETSTASGYTIVADEGKGSVKSQTKGTLSFNSEPMKIKEGMNEDVIPIIQTFGYWLFFYIIPVFLLICIAIYYRHYLKINSDIEIVKSRKASKIAKQRLRKAEICIKKGESERFYDVMLESLLGYVGDKLKIPNSELNRNNIRTVFEEKGLNLELAEKLINIIDECEYSKYSSQISSTDMHEVYDQGADVIDDIENVLKKQN